jgi:hypothetical protein
VKTTNETLARRHELALEALEALEEQAVTLGSAQASEYTKRQARTRLAAAALVYAGRVRRLAGVR